MDFSGKIVDLWTTKHISTSNKIKAFLDDDLLELVDKSDNVTDDEDLNEVNELMDEMSEFYNDSEETSAAIEESLAKSVNTSLRSKIPDSKFKEIKSKYKRPENCQNLMIPSVNEEVWGEKHSMLNAIRSRDLKLQKIMGYVIKGMIPAIETTNDILKAALKKNTFEPTKNLRKMTDGIRMFAASYTQLNQYRKENFKPIMVGKFKKHTYTNNSVSDKLFGDDLQKKIEDIQKSKKISVTGFNTGFTEKPSTSGYNNHRNSSEGDGFFDIFGVFNNIIELKWNTTLIKLKWKTQLIELQLDTEPFHSSTGLNCTNFLKSYFGRKPITHWFFWVIHVCIDCLWLYWGKRPCKVQKQAGRCNLISYLGQQKRSNWTKPSSTEGPVGYGLTHPFCTDCSGCNSALFNCGEIKTEYISVEYARDVEIQSTIGNTTQEAVSLYFNSNFTNVCVVNSGFHDMVLPALTDRLYVKNVQFYVQQLVQTCQNVIWISMTAVRGDKGFPQNNRRIHLWNRLMKEMLRNKFPKVGFMDFFLFLIPLKRTGIMFT
ncbi:unnamed protein product [Mytilus edulis]|uniref:Uncharacterized protein n=1 Tax=Mytilus edulis TaxID=6550 RepID=A0A8S3SCK4_MYTED|nr:unnamed protein product [Mytilus edulis]